MAAPAPTPTPTPMRSLLGPLTTVFTSKTWCSEAIVVRHTSEPFAYQAQSCLGPTTDANFGMKDDFACWPDRGSPNVKTPSSLPFFGWGFYSPGIECPSGMTSACTSVHGETRPAAQSFQFPFQFPLSPSETAVGCCPLGYSCHHLSTKTATGQDLILQSCYKIISIGEPFATAQCESANRRVSQGFAVLPSTVTFNTTFSSQGVSTPLATATTTVITDITLLAPMIQINWQSTDRPGVSGSGGPRSTPTPLPDIQITSATGGLSVGATAGIAVSVIVVGLAVLGLAVWMLLRRRRQREQEQGDDRTNMDEPVDDDEEATARARYPSGAASELPGSSLGDYINRSPSLTVAAYPSPESGYGQSSGSYFQPHGIESVYDQGKAELESPPIHEMPAQGVEDKRDRAELNG